VSLSNEAVAEGTDFLRAKHCRAQGNIRKDTAISYNENLT
jgi:hypothetical protein